jgi:hypothetical protein
VLCQPAAMHVGHIKRALRDSPKMFKFARQVDDAGGAFSWTDTVFVSEGELLHPRPPPKSALGHKLRNTPHSAGVGHWCAQGMRRERRTNPSTRTRPLHLSYHPTTDSAQR